MRTLMRLNIPILIIICLSLVSCFDSKADTSVDFKNDDTNIDDVLTQWGVDLSVIPSFDSVTVIVFINNVLRDQLHYSASDLDSRHRISYLIGADESRYVQIATFVWKSNWIIGISQMDFTAGENVIPPKICVITPLEPTSVRLFDGNGVGSVPFKSLMQVQYSTTDVGGQDVQNPLLMQKDGIYWNDLYSSTGFQYDFGGDGVIDFVQDEYFISGYLGMNIKDDSNLIPLPRGIVKTADFSFSSAKTLNQTSVTISSSDSIYSEFHYSLPEDTSAFGKYVTAMLAQNNRSYNFALNPDVNLFKTVGEIALWPDPRDGKQYPWRRIGSQIWMLKNMEYTGAELFSRSNRNPDSLGGYTVYYDSASAMNVCPEQWRLPKPEDWKTLVDFVSNVQPDFAVPNDGTTPSLHSKTGWSVTTFQTKSSNPDQADLFGFNSYPTGVALRRIYRDTTLVYLDPQCIGNCPPTYLTRVLDTTLFFIPPRSLSNFAAYWSAPVNSGDAVQSKGVFVISSSEYGGMEDPRTSGDYKNDSVQVIGMPIRCIFNQ